MPAQTLEADALIVTDVQNDFLPGGALAVAGGDRIIAPLNRCLAQFGRRGRAIFATRDWHPPDHCSFRERGGPWPPHCIAGSEGAQFAAALALPPDVEIISKATSRDREAYSAFEGTPLATRLRTRGCRSLAIGGLATEYCVRATTLDALQAGFAVVVLADAVGAIEQHPGDGQRALAEMAARGARLAGSDQACHE